MRLIIFAFNCRHVSPSREAELGAIMKTWAIEDKQSPPMQKSHGESRSAVAEKIMAALNRAKQPLLVVEISNTIGLGVDATRARLNIMRKRGEVDFSIHDRKAGAKKWFKVDGDALPTSQKAEAAA